MLVLQKLTGTEKMLIAMDHTVMKVHRWSTGETSCKGIMPSMDQETSTIMSNLHLLPEDLPMHIVQKINQVHRADAKIKKTNKKIMCGLIG